MKKIDMSIKQTTDWNRQIRWFLLFSGLLSLLLSIFLESVLLVFIGLGLTFWGGLMFYIQPERNVSETILKSTLYPYLENLEKTLFELGFTGIVVYIPQKYLPDSEDCKIFIAKDKKVSFATVEQIRQQENKIILRQPNGILLIPPGSTLVGLFEKVLGLNFNSIDLASLKEKLSQVLVEELNIASDINLEFKNVKNVQTERHILIPNKYKKMFDSIIIRIVDPIQFITYTDIKSLKNNTYPFYFPLISAIVCIIVKATAEPIIIEDIQYSEDHNIITAVFKSLEPIQVGEGKISPPTENIETSKD